MSSTSHSNIYIPLPNYIKNLNVQREQLFQVEDENTTNQHYIIKKASELLGADTEPQ
jgi:hypothetical protein